MSETVACLILHQQTRSILLATAAPNVLRATTTGRNSGIKMCMRATVRQRCLRLQEAVADGEKRMRGDEGERG